MSNNFIWPMDRNLSGATIPGQSEGVLYVPQSFHITCLVSYPGHLLWLEMQMVYFTAPAWAVHCYERTYIYIVGIFCWKSGKDMMLSILFVLTCWQMGYHNCGLRQLKNYLCISSTSNFDHLLSLSLNCFHCSPTRKDE